MNIEVRELVGDAERALRAGDSAAACRAYAAAGRCAAGFGLWRASMRMYKRGLELDLLDRTSILEASSLATRLGIGEWDDYRRVADVPPAWPHFGCRTSNIVIGDAGAVIECPHVGPVLEVMMTADDLVEVIPDARFRGMPLPMALLVVRRALWANPREQATEPSSIRVMFEGRSQVRLDELGDWEPM